MQNIGTLFWDVGSHTEYLGNLTKTLKNAISFGMTTTQFFFGSPYNFKRARTTFDDISSAKKLCKRFPTNVFFHYALTTNLAGSIKALAWNGDKQQDSKTRFVISELEYELSVNSNFSDFGKCGVVIHPGNFRDREKGLSSISKSINEINFVEGSKLILENAAGKGDSLATTFQELKTIYDGIDEEKRKYIGFCIDTAHICGYGLYDLSKCSEVKKMFKDFDNILGLDKLSLIHLNDSIATLGSKKDLHQCLGNGVIWENSFDSLILMLNTCKRYKIPMVLETVKTDMYTICMLKKM